MWTLATDIEGEHIALIAIVGGLLFVTMLSLGGLVKSVLARRQVEQSRREIAAYVAEGSMTPDDAERLLNSGPRI
ncbi:MAG: hypothetical protein KF757_04275 [Phycisphaeraceae bacterium]|nr:hypothetical protein [Phycisphaeraceae bacterium]MCW5764189.1 hypothetical protein [Phycisphaeraceae bacterium]